MRILHVIVGLNVGGAELMLLRLIRSHLDGDVYEHEVVSLTGVGVVGGQLRDMGVTVHALNMKSGLSALGAIVALSRLIRGRRPAIVQTWMYHADLLGGIAARLAGNCKLIWGIRTTDVEAGGTPATTFVRRVCAVLSHRVPHRIVCAAEASRKAHVAVGYDATRMVVVPNGFDTARLRAAPGQAERVRAEAGLVPEHLVIGVLGRFNPAKDHANFVRAAGLLAQRYRHVRFLMVGRGLHHSNTQLSEWINQTGFPEHFVLLAERTDVASCLSAMDIFCLSSKTEGFPNVVGEAMAMARPCVVTDVGDAALLLGDTGVVVPKGDSPALAAGLAELIDLPASERDRLGLAAQQRIYHNFTMENARVRFENIYGAVLGQTQQEE